MGPDERVIWRGRPSFWNWWLELGLADLLLVLALALALEGQGRAGLVSALCALFLFVGVALKRSRRLYLITTQRLIARSGFWSKQEEELELRDVRTLNLRQRFWQRLAGFGDLEIASSSGIQLRFAGIARPEFAKERLRGVRVGLHEEPRT